MAGDKKAGAERREYFRVTEQTVIAYRQVERDKYQRKLTAKPDDVVDSFDLAAQFAEMERKVRLIRQRLISKNRDIVDYFDLIDQKLNLVAKSALLGSMGDKMQQAREADLSAGGVRFRGPDPVVVGGHVELRVVLLPDYSGITVCAKVIRCDDLGADAQDNLRYMIALEFDIIEEADRDLLIKHLLEKQREMLRARRDAE